MHIENGKMVWGRKNCEHCDEGKQPTRIRCPECKGTGNGKRGGRGGCHKCRGLRDIWSNDHPMTCTTCNGNYINFTVENQCDYMPSEVWQSLNFKVYRHKRLLTGNEAILGLGCVFSCTDYGAAWENPDDEKLIKEVKASTSHQATKVTKDDGTVCDHVGIFVCPGGYSVRPVFESVEAVEMMIGLERPEREYMAVGQAICEAGGNGTFGAIYRS